MKIDNKYYRIIEKTYEDGHKEYVAQQAINFIFFKWWKNYVHEKLEYGYATVNCIYSYPTYNDCYNSLIFNIEMKRDKLKNQKLVKTEIYK